LPGESLRLKARADGGDDHDPDEAVDCPSPMAQRPHVGDRCVCARLTTAAANGRAVRPVVDANARSSAARSQTCDSIGRHGYTSDYQHRSITKERRFNPESS
jgi:hypothetical protein